MPRKSSIEGGGSAHKAERIVDSENFDVTPTVSELATDKINKIEGFSEMDVIEKRQMIVNLLNTLASNNDNRFLCEEIARQFSEIESKELHERHIAELRAAA